MNRICFKSAQNLYQTKNAEGSRCRRQNSVRICTFHSWSLGEDYDFLFFFRNPISADLILCEETPLLYWANCLNREKKRATIIIIKKCSSRGRVLGSKLTGNNKSLVTKYLQCKEREDDFARLSLSPSQPLASAQQKQWYLCNTASNINCYRTLKIIS